MLRLEPQLLELAEFINRRGLRHMDAHFENIVCDGEDIYLTDFPTEEIERLLESGAPG